jgi:uncharacterized membrane protein
MSLFFASSSKPVAAAIASLGLLQDSAAVVIGSMLLAPLMSPMVGLGLGLAQTDIRLLRPYGKSTGLGVLLTLTVSFLIGIVTPAGETLTDEVLARGGPNILDLLIAVFAATAATFSLAAAQPVDLCRSDVVRPVRF